MTIALTFVFSPIYSYADDIYLSKTMGMGINWNSTANYWSPNTPPSSSTTNNYYVGNDTTTFQVRSEENNTSSTFPGNNSLYLGYTGPSSLSSANYPELILKSWTVTINNFYIGNATIGQSKGEGTITLNSSNMTVEGSLTFDSGHGRNINVNNVIKGTGSITKKGAEGVLILSGANTYSGGTTISAGTVKLDGNSARLGSGNVTIAENAALELSGASSGLHRVPSLSGSGAINITANSYFSLANENAQEYSGTFNISKTLHLGYQDEEDLTHYGPANLNLPNATVSLQSSGILALDFDNNNLAPSSITIKTLNGIAGTTVRAGGSGSPTNPCTITVGDGNFAGVIGVNNNALQSKLNLIKNTSGTLTLSGANLYNGGTTISDGILKLTGAGTLGTGAVTNSGTLEFNNSTATITPNISGAGDILVSAGTATLSGAVTQTGGTTTLADGTTLNIGNASTLYNLAVVDENASATLNITGNLTLNNSDLTKFIGSITAPVVTKTGLDTLQLCFDAENAVNLGSLVVSSGPVDLKGYMSGGITVDSGAVFSPGNSIGEAKYGGGYELKEGATLLLEVGKNEQGDILTDTLTYVPNLTDPKDTVFEDGSIIKIALDSSYENAFEDGDQVDIQLPAGIKGSNGNDLNLNNLVLQLGMFELVGYDSDSGVLSVRLSAPAAGVPEPSTWALLALGVVVLFLRKRVRN